jgi:NhaA family Na+:H+ antiporter
MTATEGRSMRTPRSDADVPGRALPEFFATEVAGGVALVAAAVVALVWANSPWSESYHDLWTTEVRISLGAHALAMDLRHWVNDGLMAIFFVVVALEVKRELLEGELRDRRRASLPVVAAIGGMAVPAAVFLVLNLGGTGSAGWGIPMATDIAFALGVAALVGRSLPPGLRLFLLALAIVDDIGAIVVIAVFYSSGLELSWLGGGLALVGLVYVLRRAGIFYPPLFVAIGAAMWVALHECGVHPTLAGVAMGLLAPARPAMDPADVAARRDELLDLHDPRAARRTSQLARSSISQMEWLEHGLHPWTSLGIVPLFALANAGVSLSGSSLGDAARSPVAWGVLAGLVVGKIVGITGFAWLATRTGVAVLPVGATWRQVTGTAALAGIGFTVSIFVTGLAFDRSDLVAEAKIGILAASLIATGLAAVLLLGGPDAARAEPEPEP